MTTLCTVTTLNCPAEVLIPWASYHLNLGINHMFLFFDDPGHPAISALQHDPRITAVRCDADYWPGGAEKRQKLTLHERQWFNANKAFNWARDRGFEWITHIDSDELIYCTRPLRPTLNLVPRTVDVVRLPVFEFVPQQLQLEHPFSGTHSFRVGPKRPTRKAQPRSFLEWVGCVAHLTKYYSRLGIAKLCCPGARGPFLRGHTGGKSFVRLTADIAGMGVHLPAPPNGKPFRQYFLPAGALLHYDCGDFEHWLHKWTQRATETHVPRGRDAKRRRQVERFRTVRDNDGLPGLQSLFFREYGLQPWEIRILSALRLVHTLNVPADAFSDDGIGLGSSPSDFVH